MPKEGGVHKGGPKMLLPPFEYHEPETLDEACMKLFGLADEAKILAGGTDLLVNMKKKVLRPKNLISIELIPGLGSIDFSGDQVVIGCNVTAAEVAESSVIKHHFPILVEGAGSLGSPLIRNRATIAGNIITARPAADTLPPLMALDARVVLKRQPGERTVEIRDLLKGPGETDLRADEILTSIIIEKMPPFSGGAYIKLGQRNALEIALVNVASLLVLSGDKGHVKRARIVMGAVGPTPLRALKAEEYLEGSIPDEKAFTKAADIAAEESRPITDHRASAEYRRWMVANLTKRTLLQAYDRAKRNR
jgi:carbon-monoxide dehydrogenase medium subunit